MIINANNAGIPKIVKVPTVIKFIGIIKFNDVAIKLYPYKINALIIIFFKTVNTFFIIISPIKNMYFNKYYS